MEHKSNRNVVFSAPWTHSYFVGTVGGAPLAVVKQYIESQKRSEVR